MFIEFEPNKPETLVFGDSKPVALSSGEVAYTLGDGRLLRLAPAVAQSLADLQLLPGEQFQICLHLGGPKDPYWSVWLSPESEKARAAVENPGLRLVSRTSRKQPVVDGQEYLFDGAAALRPNSPEMAGAEADPLSQKLAGGDRRPAGGRIPMDVAFREIVQFVAAELAAAGEQWSDESKQDAVSTLFIAAGKAGWLGPWERGAA